MKDEKQKAKTKNGDSIKDNNLNPQSIEYFLKHYTKPIKNRIEKKMSKQNQESKETNWIYEIEAMLKMIGQPKDENGNIDEANGVIKAIKIDVHNIRLKKNNEIVYNGADKGIIEDSWFPLSNIRDLRVMGEEFLEEIYESIEDYPLDQMISFTTMNWIVEKKFLNPQDNGAKNQGNKQYGGNINDRLFQTIIDFVKSKKTKNKSMATVIAHDYCILHNVTPPEDFLTQYFEDINKIITGKTDAL
jgi:hypothetical protein